MTISLSDFFAPCRPTVDGAYNVSASEVDHMGKEMETH
jgi:hypothetical protein